MLSIKATATQVLTDDMSYILTIGDSSDTVWAVCIWPATRKVICYLPTDILCTWSVSKQRNWSSNEPSLLGKKLWTSTFWTWPADECWTECDRSWPCSLIEETVVPRSLKGHNTLPTATYGWGSPHVFERSTHTIKQAHLAPNVPTTTIPSGVRASSKEDAHSVEQQPLEIRKSAHTDIWVLINSSTIANWDGTYSQLTLFFQ